MNVQELKKQLEFEESRKSKAYKDHLGVTTIGVGRNLDDVGLSEDEIDYLLSNDIERVEKDLQSFPWWHGLDPVRQVALANLRFQLGPGRFRGFKKMIAALQRGDYEKASYHLLDSKYATQTPNRAKRIAHKLRFG